MYRLKSIFFERVPFIHKYIVSQRLGHLGGKMQNREARLSESRIDREDKAHKDAELKIGLQGEVYRAKIDARR